eukprot:5619437-Heterocapsa_arctica.AAC.1
MAAKATRVRHRPGGIVGHRGKPHPRSSHGLRHLDGRRHWTRETMRQPNTDRRPGRRTRPHKRAAATMRRAGC